MSTVNAVTIFTENLQASNLVVGNSTSRVTLQSNTISISIGNVNITPDSIRIGNSTQNSVITSTSLTTNSITINSVTYTNIVGSLALTDYQVFKNPAAINRWYKPAWAKDNDVVTIMMWGGGGGGTTISGIDGSGGGGGACVLVNKLAGECNSVCNVVVGVGGSYVANSANAVQGQSSTFWINSTSSIVAYAGAAGFANSTLAGGGGGGGWFTIGVINVSGGSPLEGASGNPGGSSTFGGGGGGKGVAGLGGNSVYGGGGGSYNANVGVSVFGGNGGNATVLASPPGGGGGFGSNGARGEVRVWVTGQSR